MESKVVTSKEVEEGVFIEITLKQMARMESMTSTMQVVKAMATEVKIEVEAHIEVAQEDLEVDLVNVVAEAADLAVVARATQMTTTTKSSTNPLKSKNKMRVRKKC